MARHCAWCDGTDTQEGFDQRQCLECGRLTTVSGERTVASSEANEGVTVEDQED